MKITDIYWATSPFYGTINEPQVITHFISIQLCKFFTELIMVLDMK